MKIYSSSLELLQSPLENRQGLHLTVGNFDGLHKGHQALLEQARKCQKEQGGFLCVYSFDPHPQVFFKPPGEHTYLENRSVWRDRLASMGVDVLIEEKFTKEFAALTAEEFLEKHWDSRLGIKSVTVGVDFRFGQGRKGDRALLEKWCQKNGIAFFAISPVMHGEERISTSKIKSLLGEGKVSTAAQFLGRPFSIRGVVQTGEQRGRKLGFPTLNLMEDSAKLLKRGVYLSDVFIGNKKYSGITNVGVRPTLHQSSPVVVETHLVKPFSQDIYGQEVEIQFVEFVREERKFSSLEDLKKQIDFDVKLAESRKQ